MQLIRDALNDIILHHLGDSARTAELVLNATNDKADEVQVSETVRKKLVQQFLKLRCDNRLSGVGPEPFNKFFLRAFLNLNNIRFEESLDMGEDMIFNVQVSQKISRLAIISIPFYTYAPNETSISVGLHFDVVKNTQHF